MLNITHKKKEKNTINIYDSIYISADYAIIRRFVFETNRHLKKENHSLRKQNIEVIFKDNGEVKIEDSLG
jgi:hypothetical protein